MQMLSEDDLNIKELQRPANTQHSALIEFWHITGRSKRRNQRRVEFLRSMGVEFFGTISTS